MADVSRLLASAARWQEKFHEPLPLGAKARLSIVTCMDSRIIPEQIFELRVGDAEIIRNAGGRVTEDVVRSLTVAQEILKTRTIFVIHHTDCGGMHAVQRHKELISVMVHHLGFFLGSILRFLDFFKLTSLLLKPINPTSGGLVDSVVDDITALKRHPLIPADIEMYGFVYSTDDGSLKQVAKHVPRGVKDVRHMS
ncbi:hypothetical protein WJX73_004862 [Symbiochloris irregularis]|uniref:Carbonic anhydrase n=1 Tax=Symbiochloris irregularis TaxID=706552 RepID=A0AAW1P9M1_9CHLO